MKRFSYDIEWPCELSAEIKALLLECAIEVNGVPKRNPNSRAQQGGVFYVTQGIMSVTFSADKTNTMNAGLVGSGMWFGGTVMSSDISFNATLDEILPISFLYFPKEKVDKLAQANHEVYKWLYYSTVEVQKDWIQAQICSLYDRESRVVFSLLQIAQRLPSVQGSLIKIDISQKQLSQITGISRPRLNEVLKALEAQGEVSLERGSIHLLELNALQQRVAKLTTHLKV